MANISAVVRQLHELCSKCRDVFSLLESFPVDFERRVEKTCEFHNIQELIQSSTDGCHLCTLIVTEMYPNTKAVLLSRIEKNGTDGEHMIVRIMYWDPKIPRNGRYLYDEPYIDLEWPETGLTIGSDSDSCQIKFHTPDGSLERYRLTRPVQPLTQSWGTFNDIHQWLRQCELTHWECREREKRQTSQLPTRLLYIPASDEHNVVYLREGEGIPPESKYMTLSHCWGNAVGQKKLLAAEYASCVNGMPLGSLPQTFRDAVVFTKTLGIEYLWVDSLCIIQDSHEDWARECSRMSAVYSGSFLNVAANDSTNSNGGLFRKRDPLAVNPVLAQVTFAPIQWENKPFILFPHTMGHGALYHAPLSSRAWVVQEQLLAPRTVHFLKHKVVWQCSDLYASESDAEGRVESGHWSLVRRWGVLDPKYLHANFLSQWVDAVELYSRGILTHESDKLVAISGIARYLQALCQDDSLQYYAGIWSYLFEEQLLWFTVGEGHRTAAYQAPSWSWASYNGGIRIWHVPNENRHLLAKALEIHTEPIGDTFGPVRSGYFKIRGPLCRAQAVRSEDTWTKSMILVPSGSLIEFAALRFDEGFDIIGHDGDNEFVLLGMIRQSEYATAPIIGLVLEPTRAKHGEYRRFGYFRMNEHSESDDESGYDSDDGLDAKRPLNPGFSSLENAFASMDIPADLYESFDEAGKVYTISII